MALETRRHSLTILSRYHLDAIFRCIDCFFRCWIKQKMAQLSAFFNINLFPRLITIVMTIIRAQIIIIYWASLKVCFFNRGRIVLSCIGVFWFLLGKLFLSSLEINFIVALLWLFYRENCERIQFLNLWLIKPTQEDKTNSYERLRTARRLY